jgi:hypothetical protein
MSIGSYFVNDEAEKAAKWDALEDFRKTKHHRIALESEMGKLGRLLKTLSFALEYPQQCSFDIGDQTIGVASGRERLLVEPSHLNWASVTKLLEDYNATVRRIAEMEPKYRDLM